MNAVQAQRRLKHISEELNEVVEFANQTLQKLQEKEEHLKQITVTGAEAASLIGYKSAHSFYNQVEALKFKGWLRNGYSYVEVIALRDYRKEHGSLTDIPAKEDYL